MRPSQAFVFFIDKKVALALLCIFVLCGVITDTTGKATDGQVLTLGQTILHAPPANKAVRPVLAFYYMWYTAHDWCLCHMSDLPTIRYNSNDIATIDRQLAWAANAGITGFISSWWGQGQTTDRNFAQLLARSTALENSSGQHFASSIYFESDSSALNSESKIVAALRYISVHYANDSHYFHWHGKPVIFFTDPLGHGRTLAMWSDVRRQVDPHNRMLWSAEGVDMSMLNVFDGIHLFSAGYWGLLHNNMKAVDQEFSSKVASYNRAHHTQKIWAAGVEPGYNDTRVPGRKFTYIVPRNNGATYRTSWQAAIASNPTWITITTFNEWFEGAMIEPGVHYGDQYMRLTAQFASQWRL
jgi:hypothetical protein